MAERTFGNRDPGAAIGGSFFNSASINDSRWGSNSGGMVFRSGSGPARTFRLVPGQLWLQVTLERQAPAVDVSLHLAQGNSQLAGDFFVRQVVEMKHHQRHALSARKFLQGGFEQ